MNNKRVAGTIMLHLQDGSKKFLMHSDEKRSTFAITDFSEEITGLASILQFFKDKASINVKNIQLVELTNAHFHEENIPLFVFETNEKDCSLELSDSFYWEEPSKLKGLLETIEFEGVPHF